MDLPMIIVEFGQQRQRLKLNKFSFNINELIELFSQTFNISFNLKNYEILLFNKPIDSITNINFTHLDQYQRFKIQYIDSSISNNQNEIISLKQRLNTISKEIIEVNFLINSIYTNCKNLIQKLTDENNSVSQINKDLTVPPGFKPLSNTSTRDSQSTDEGIDRDTGSISIFESAHSDYELESIYVECREDVTIINQPNQVENKSTKDLEWRNQPYRVRPQWNSNKVKYQSNYNKDQFGEKPRLKKTINPNKTPLSAEKKKNIPCKYAAGGNCKRGSQCRFIHVV